MHDSASDPAGSEGRIFFCVEYLNNHTKNNETCFTITCKPEKEACRMKNRMPAEKPCKTIAKNVD